jgi:hypothetical protein
MYGTMKHNSMARKIDLNKNTGTKRKKKIREINCVESVHTYEIIRVPNYCN